MGSAETRYFTWSGSNQEPPKGRRVSFSVYNYSCTPGEPPLADYRGEGIYLGSCAEGFMTRVTECTKQSVVGQVVYTYSLHLLT